MQQRNIRVVHGNDQVRMMFGAGDEYRFLATGDDTDGAYFLVEATVPPGGGPPPHIQTREEEAFYILEGTLTFYGVEGEIEARPGSFVNVPKGARHNFRNNTEHTARMLFFFAPAGIEHLFSEFAEMEPPTSDPAAAIQAMNRLAEKYGVEYFPS